MNTIQLREFIKDWRISNSASLDDFLEKLNLDIESGMFASIIRFNPDAANSVRVYMDTARIYIANYEEIERVQATIDTHPEYFV